MSQKHAKPTTPAPATQISIGGDVGGDVVLGNKTHTQTAGGDIVGGDKIGAEAATLATAFKELYQQIATAPADPNVDKAEIQETVQKIEGEIKKGEQANANKVERWLLTLGAMSEDIFAVTAATLTNPLLGIAKTIQLIAQKAKAEHAKQAEKAEKTAKGPAPQSPAPDISE